MVSQRQRAEIVRPDELGKLPALTIDHSPLGYFLPSRIGVTVTFRYVTFSWSPWIMTGPGSASLASSAPPVTASRVTLSCTFCPFSTTVTLLATMVASIVCHSPTGLLALTFGACQP